jgi:hypothetical protein
MTAVLQFYAGLLKFKCYSNVSQIPCIVVLTVHVYNMNRESEMKINRGGTNYHKGSL